MSRTRLNAAQLELFESSVAELKKVCPCGQLDKGERREIATAVRSHALWRWADAIELIDAYELQSAGYRGETERGALIFLQLDAHQQIVNSKTGGWTKRFVELYCGLRLSLARDYGRVTIRPERVVDKMLEWVMPEEVDFDQHPKFSKKYFVMTKDQEKLRAAVNHEFLDALASRDELFVTLNGSTFTAGRKRIVQTTDDVVDLGRLGRELLAIGR